MKYCENDIAHVCENLFFLYEYLYRSISVDNLLIYIYIYIYIFEAM